MIHLKLTSSKYDSSVLRAVITSLILFFVPLCIFIEATGNEKWGMTDNDSNGMTFGRQAFAFLVATCLGNLPTPSDTFAQSLRGLT